MDDVVAHVVLSGGDEPLDTFDAPSAIAVVKGLRATGADVGSSIGLGQHHRGAPLLLDHELGHLLLRLVAEVVEDAGESGSRHVHECGGVRAEHEFGHGPPDAGRAVDAAKLLGQLQAPALGVHQCLVGGLEVLGHLHRVRGRVIHRRVAVGGGECFREQAGGQRVGVLQEVLGGLDVDVLERCRAHSLGPAKNLEQVELDVSQVALVVGHRCLLPC